MDTKTPTASVENKTLDAVVSLCKRRGFVYQSADIYGGVNGLYDFGHLGALMKENIRNAWRKAMRGFNGDILFFDGTILSPSQVWEASGHVAGFHDPMVDCLGCKKRFRADDIDMAAGCPSCGGKAWTDIKQFNMMFKTFAGASAEHGTSVYLRPETAQNIFVQFKNIISSSRVKVPFGVAQIGKAFRNEITPKQFLFRMREFEQMELEWFCTREQASDYFSLWIQERLNFYASIGIARDHIQLHTHSKEELAHYSVQCVDVEYLFPFGWKELEGIAHRGNFDLTQHTQHSGKNLSTSMQEGAAPITPDVVECSVGVDRLFTALLCEAYREETVDGDTRIVLALHPAIAPVKAAFLPLSKKLSPEMYAMYQKIKSKGVWEIDFDDAGSIGKRYRRHDEIGTPLCITYDFDSVQDSCVTVRNRDTLQQERIHVDSIESYIYNFLQ